MDAALPLSWHQTIPQRILAILGPMYDGQQTLPLSFDVGVSELAAVAIARVIGWG